MAVSMGPALRTILVSSLFLGTNLFGLQLSAENAADDSCQCLDSECSPCEYSEGFSFYTAKCENGKKVKSCKKAKCLPLNPRPTGCEGQEAKQSESPEKSPNLGAGSPQITQAHSVGRMEEVTGEVSISRKGDLTRADVGTEVFESDLIQTGTEGYARVIFSDGNVIQISKKSKFKVAFHSQDPSARSTLLHLMYGKIRAQVQKTQYAERPTFRIRTPSAVAGVRGTDFVTEYSPETKTSRVLTLEGKVELGGQGDSKIVQIPKGMLASYVATGAGHETLSDSDLSTYAGGGVLSQATTIPELEIAQIDRDWSQSKKVLARNDQEDRICSEPAGRFNDCAWVCKNNPQGAATCRTDVKGVACVKKRCNAGGQWADETRLPASAKELCSPQNPRVAPCGNN